MKGSFRRLFGRLILLTAVVGSFFALQAPVLASGTISCVQTVITTGAGSSTFVAAGSAFNGYPFTVQTIECDVYDGATFVETNYAYTSTTSPEWNGGGGTLSAADHQYTLKVTDITSGSATLTIPLWTPPALYNQITYTCSSSGFAMLVDTGTGGLGSGPWTMGVTATSGGGTIINSAAEGAGTLINGDTAWEFDISGLSASSTYYWGLSNSTSLPPTSDCTIGVGTVSG